MRISHLVLVLALILTVTAVMIATAPRCKPGDVGVYLGGAIHISGCMEQK